jgi:hypothetical protein
LKPPGVCGGLCGRESPLTQGRGLKLSNGVKAVRISLSPLTQGRGLKQSLGGLGSGPLRSPLTQGRGLKLIGLARELGVITSPLTQGRGLKRRSRGPACPPAVVAPHAGAWIETRFSRHPYFSDHVAPHAGAWIETSARLRATARSMSPLTQGRGLKRGNDGLRASAGKSPLTQGRGLKLVRDRRAGNQGEGRPSRRGVD